MNIYLLIKAIILGMVEGFTEFLPVSSTGHLIIIGSLLNFNDNKGKSFEIIIQFGAILAVCWHFREKILNTIKHVHSHFSARVLILNIIVATFPVVILALLFNQYIKSILFSPISVAVSLIVFGVFILFVEHRYKKNKKVKYIQSIDHLSWKDAIRIGLLQCFSLIPGTSRSGSTIIGGMIFGLSRKVATEFSFFLAIPIISGAALYELINFQYVATSISEAKTFILILIPGFITSFIFASITIRWLMNYISNHDFQIFAWYRIILGTVILIAFYSDW